jgi:hypothetical protein
MTAQVRSEFLFFKDPVRKLHAHLRIERDLGEETDTITWYHFMVFIVPKSRPPMPFVRYEGMEYSYLRHLGRDNFRLHAHNLSFPRDLQTGKFTDTALNPVTGKPVKIPPTVLTTDPGTIHNPRGFRNTNSDGTYQERYAMFRLEDNLIKLDSVRGAPVEKPITHMENSCQWVDFDQFTNPAITSLPAHFVGAYLYDYPPFMEMPDSAGHMMAMFDGKKIASIEELPREYLDRVRKEYPELLKPRWSEFDKPVAFKI